MSLAATTESRLAICASSNSTCFGELVVGMNGLVMTIVAQVFRGEPASEVREELVHEGRAALCEAAVAWDGSGRFSTFAGRSIARSVIGYLRTLDGGTQWRARVQQEARRLRRLVAETIHDDPGDWELAYVASEWGRPMSYVLSEAAESQLSRVPIEGVEIAVPPEAEDGAESRYLGKWKKLTSAQRALVDQAEAMGAQTNGVSMTRLAAAVGGRRSHVEAALGRALEVLLVADP